MKGILMTSANHIATREKRKTMTRRLDGLKEINLEPDKWHLAELYQATGGNNKWWAWFSKDGQEGKPYTIMPHYQPNEIVYLKEVWATIKDNDNLSPSEIAESSAIFYKFGDNRCGDDPDELNMERGKWRSPLFLPEVFARDFVKIKGLGTQRLQDISEEDAEKEGAEFVLWHGEHAFKYEDFMAKATYKAGFSNLWDSLNGKRVRSKEYTSTYDWARGGIERKHYTYQPSPYCWDANPFVWIYSYELLENKP